MQPHPGPGPENFEKQSAKGGDNNSDDSAKLRGDVSRSDFSDMQAKVKELRLQKQLKGVMTTGTFNFGPCRIDFGQDGKQRQSKSYKITDVGLPRNATSPAGSEISPQNNSSSDIPQPKPIPPRPIELSHPQPIAATNEIPQPKPIPPRPLELLHPQPIAAANEIPQPQPIPPRPPEHSHPQAPSPDSIKSHEVAQVQPLIPKPYEISVNKLHDPPLPVLSPERHTQAVNAANAVIDKVAASAVTIPHFSFPKVETALPVVKPRVLSAPELQIQAAPLAQPGSHEIKPLEPSKRQDFIAPNPVPIEIPKRNESPAPVPVPTESHYNKNVHTEAPLPQRARSEGPSPVSIRPSIPETAPAASVDHNAPQQRAAEAPHNNYSSADNRYSNTDNRNSNAQTDTPQQSQQQHSKFLQGGTNIDVHNQPVQHRQEGAVDYSTYKAQILPTPGLSGGLSDNQHHLHANAQAEQHQRLSAGADQHQRLSAGAEQRMETHYALAGHGVLHNGRAWNMNPNDNGVTPVRPNAPEGTPITLTCTSDGKPMYGKLGAHLGNGQREMYIDGYTVVLSTIKSRH